MNFQQVLVIVSDAQACASETRVVEQAVREAGCTSASMRPEEGIAFLERAVADGTEPVTVILAPGVENMLSVARSVRTVWPRGQLILVRRTAAPDSARVGSGPALLLGQYWSLADADVTRLPRIISDAVKATRRRVQFRTFIEGANLQLDAPSPSASTEYRRRMVSDHFLSVFLANAADAIMGLDADFRVLYCSAGAQSLFATSAARVFDVPVQSLPFWNASLDTCIARIRAGEPRVVAETTFARPDSTLALEISFSRVMEADRLVGISLIFRDLSAKYQALKAERETSAQQQSKLEELVDERTRELRDSQRALYGAQKLEAIGKLTGGVAHDFNNVLQIIAGNLQLLQASIRHDTPAQRRLDAAAAAVDRAAKLSSQLLAFGRRQPLQPVSTNLGRLLRDLNDLLRRALGEAIEIETIVAAGLWNTLVDVNQLENVILNLAINARDAMDAQGKLTLELGNANLDDDYARAYPDVAAGQYVMLAVSDVGKGMTEDVIEHAFEPFFTTKPEGQGTGLGLSMAYGFVKQTSGHIKIYSEVGHGTTVRLYLPRTHAPEAIPAVEVTGPIVGGSETILVVEDDAAVRATVVDSLTALGYRVLKADDAQAALNVVQSGVPIDLLFTDVVMPGLLRSPELARRVKQLLPNIAVLFTSGYTQNAIVHGGKLDADVELLSKPYRRENLARKIRHMLSNRKIPVRHPQSPGAIKASAAPDAPGAPRGLRIMVVEDEPTLREIACEYCELLGHAAVGFADAETALEALQTTAFSVLFSDVTLPGMSGIELAQRAVRIQPGIRIIFASGYGQVDLGDANLRAASLAKPYDLDRLSRILEQA